MRKISLIILFVTTLFSTAANSEPKDLTLMLESGAVWQNRNDVRITPDQGSYVEFDKYDQGPFFHYRAETQYRIKNNHHIRAVYAPFQVSVKGTPDENLNFNNVTFAGDRELKINYQFNSYRLSYIYRILEDDDGFFDVGVTAKWRDAKIEFEQGALNRHYRNSGLVPLFYLAFEKVVFSDVRLNFTLDASAAAEGRAIDGSLKLRKPLNEDLQLGLGFRSLEGGADNEKVYTFSWLNYALIDLVWTH